VPRSFMTPFAQRTRAVRITRAGLADHLAGVVDKLGELLTRLFPPLDNAPRSVFYSVLPKESMIGSASLISELPATWPYLLIRKGYSFYPPMCPEASSSRFAR